MPTPQSKLPIQAAPVTRTTTGLVSDNEQPFRVFNFKLASRQQKINIRLGLVNGANYNAPARFSVPVDSSGCYLLAGNSMALCLASFGLP